MSSPAAVVCREVFDENSQPSAEEVSDYAQQLGIDPDSESHLLPLARDGLMQALPAPWKAYFDEKLQTHYYYNDETKKTQWEHPLDHVYRELVRKARDASAMDDTCASVQELLTSEENTKNLERVETKAESDEDLSTDSADHPSDLKEPTLLPGRRLAPLGRPPLAPLGRLDKKLGELRISPLRRSAESSVSPKPSLFRNTSDRELLSRPTSFKTDIIDLKMSVLSPEEKHNPLLAAAKVEKGLPLPLSGRGTMFLKLKSELPSPETDKSFTVDSVTKSDPPKGILREKPEGLQRKAESVMFGRQVASLDEDRKSVRFKLETLPDPTISPSSNSSSDQNSDGSIISNPVVIPSPVIPSSPVLPGPGAPGGLLSGAPGVPGAPGGLGVPGAPGVPGAGLLAPLVGRPPLPPRPNVDSPRDKSDKESVESESRESRGASPRRRVLRPPAADYIKQDLFQKNFQKISDLVRSTDIEPTPNTLQEPSVDKEVRPRSPMIPQKNKISINLMESIESETSIDSPDREFANLDLNDLDDSNDLKENIPEAKEEKESVKEDLSDHSTNSKHSKSSRIIDNIPMPNIKVPKLDFFRSPKTEFKEFKDDSKTNSRSDSVDGALKSPIKSRSDSLEAALKSPQIKISSIDKSPRDFTPWSVSSFKPKISPLKSSESTNSLGRSLTSARLDGVILSQGKSSTDNVVVVYQFETEDVSKSIKSPLLPDPGRELIERNKVDERRRLELSLQKEIESIKMEWVGKEKRLKAELQAELKEAEDKFLAEKKKRLEEQAERHKREIEEALAAAEEIHQKAMEEHDKALQERIKSDTEAAQREHLAVMEALTQQYAAELKEQRDQLEIENERALSELREQLSTALHRERASMMEENRATIDSLRDQHSDRVAELRHDYRAEVERIRTQHACHLEELRGRLASDRLAPKPTLPDKYRCLKEKYRCLKHDVKMSIERRNKRREMSMTTGSETEKSNSHKANQSLERCKELNETSVSAVIEAEPTRMNNNIVVRNNDNDSENTANNNDHWKHQSAQSAESATKQKPRRSAVAFREPPRRRRDRDRDRDKDPATTDWKTWKDSSDATTADDKPKEPVNGHGRRRCFTRLKSASTSRLNYSPKRGEGWSSPLESLRQQLRKLDDLEDQFPDLACQPAYSLRYPFTELEAVATADTPELEFVRHRALIEREGMRRARAVLKRRRAALKQTRSEREPHRAPSEERECTELEVALHRARALLGEKEIRLRHIERALRALAERPAVSVPVAVQETSSSGSSGSLSAAAGGGGAVLRSLRALHADVRDIWRALDARQRVPAITASPESSSCNAPTTSHTRMTLSAPEQSLQDNSEGVAERARGLRAWLQTTP